MGSCGLEAADGRSASVRKARQRGARACNDLRHPAIPAEGLSVNGLLAVWPSIVRYGRSARNPIEQESLFMRGCSHTLGEVIPRHGCLASCCNAIAEEMDGKLRGIYRHEGAGLLEAIQESFKQLAHRRQGIVIKQRTHPFPQHALAPEFRPDRSE